MAYATTWCFTVANGPSTASHTLSANSPAYSVPSPITVLFVVIQCNVPSARVNSVAVYMLMTDGVLFHDCIISSTSLHAVSSL